MLMDAAVLNKPMDLEFKKIDIPKPKADEVLIKVHCIGVCGSDIHYYEHGEIGRFKVEEPLILGHELAGDIIKVGSEVKGLEIHDRVAVEPGVACGKCDFCKKGRYNLCPEVSFMATPPVDGAWAEYVTVRSDFVFKLPETMSYEEGALIEPLSVGLHAMNRGKVTPADTILVTGLGPIGLLAIQAAKMNGVTEIYASDTIPMRRKIAKESGAIATIDPANTDVQEQINSLTKGKGVDVIIETSGNSIAVSDSVHTINRGGRIVFVGMPTASEIPINITQIVDSEIDVYGVFRYVNTYPTAIQASNNADIQKIITHKYALSDIYQAIETARLEKDKSVKIMIYPN